MVILSFGNSEINFKSGVLESRTNDSVIPPTLTTNPVKIEVLNSGIIINGMTRSYKSFDEIYLKSTSPHKNAFSNSSIFGITPSGIFLSFFHTNSIIVLQATTRIRLIFFYTLL